MSGSAACWWPGDDAAAPTADPTAPAAVAPPDDIALEARLPAPAAIESYQAPCRVGANGSGDSSAGSVREPPTAWAAPRSAVPRGGPRGRLRPRLHPGFPSPRRAGLGVGA